MLTVAVERALTSPGFFIEDIQRGGVVAARGVAGPLPSSLVTRLIGVPQLPAVVAELRVASLATAAQLGTLGTAVRYHCIAEGCRGIAGEIKSELIKENCL